MRRELMSHLSHQKDILIIKDFSRRNGRGLVELEDLRDAGGRIISVGENVDFPNNDDWLKIQFYFMINETPVTDTSKKVKAVIKRRQSGGGPGRPSGGAESHKAPAHPGHHEAPGPGGGSGGNL